MFERITRQMSSPARTFANEIMVYLHDVLSDNYRFVAKLVGSAAWNTILKDKNGFFDVDYQLLLGTNSQEYKDNHFNNPTKIKNDFFNYVNSALKNNKQYKVENSTTAITVIDKKNKFSIDFVIIRVLGNNSEIIRRNNKKYSSINEFTWNQLPNLSKAYVKFDNLKTDEKQELIEKYVLPRKAKEKAKQENDPTKKSSCEVFIEEINNYVARKRNNRL